jgi:tetratricopeptide (TPR) repeat protein
MKKYFLLSLFLLLVGCSTELDDLRVSDEQVNRMQVLYNQADGQLDTDPAKAIQTAKRMLELAERMPYRAGRGDAHHLLGLAYDFKGKYDSAAYHHTKALEERRELDDETKKAKSYVNLGIIYRRLGMLKEARDYQETAIMIWKKLGDVQNEANAYRNLGLVEQEAKRYDQAEAAYKHSLHLHQRLGNQAKVARLYNDLGAVNELKESGDSTANDSTILAYYQQALRLSSTGDEYALGWLLGNIGRSYNSLHQPDSGLGFLLQAKTKLENLPLETQRKHTLIGVYNGIAESYIQKLDFTRALIMLEKAERLDQVVTGSFREEFLDTYQLFQDIYTAQKKPAQVNHYQKKHQGIQAELANIAIVAENVQLKAQVQVKNQENFFLWQTRVEMERMYNLMQIILIPVCLLLIIGGWRHYKQSRMMKIYNTVLINALPGFDFTDTKVIPPPDEENEEKKEGSNFD